MSDEQHTHHYRNTRVLLQSPDKNRSASTGHHLGDPEADSSFQIIRSALQYPGHRPRGLTLLARPRAGVKELGDGTILGWQAKCGPPTQDLQANESDPSGTGRSRQELARPNRPGLKGCRSVTVSDRNGCVGLGSGAGAVLTFVSCSCCSSETLAERGRTPRRNDESEVREST